MIVHPLLFRYSINCRAIRSQAKYINSPAETAQSSRLTIVARRLKNLDTLFNGSPSVSGIVRWIDRRQQRDIDAKVLVRKLPRLSNSLAKSIGRRLRQRGQYTFI